MINDKFIVSSGHWTRFFEIEWWSPSTTAVTKTHWIKCFVIKIDEKESHWEEGEECEAKTIS